MNKKRKRYVVQTRLLTLRFEEWEFLKWFEEGTHRSSRFQTMQTLRDEIIMPLVQLAKLGRLPGKEGMEFRVSTYEKENLVDPGECFPGYRQEYHNYWSWESDTTDRGYKGDWIMNGLPDGRPHAGALAQWEPRYNGYLPVDMPDGYYTVGTEVNAMFEFHRIK